MAPDLRLIGVCSVEREAVNDKFRERGQEKIDPILNWSEEHPEFGTDFVEHMSDLLDEGKDLTVSQSLALTNIIEKWRIEE